MMMMMMMMNNAKNKIINKKDKGTKKRVVKKRLMVENYKQALFNNETILRLHQRFISNHHTVNTENVNKVALSNNDDKRLQTFDGITTYPYRTNAIMVGEREMLVMKKEIPIALYY